MTYNLSPGAVEAAKDLLDEIANLAGMEELTIGSDAPHKLGYRIREALAAARANNLEPYCNLEVQVSVGENHVTVRRRHTIRRLIGTIKRTMSEEVIPDATTEFQVIAILSKARPGRHVFPSFSGDLTAVKNWITQKGLTLEREEPLTIVKGTSS
jgi:hypothetical protein